MRRLLTAALLLALATQPALAAIFNVGPDGDYPTLQAALDIAVANGQDDNIRIQIGTLVSAGTSFDHAEDFYIELQGGFDASFTTTVEDPSLTVLSGDGSGRALEFSLGNGQMQISNLSFADGVALAGGGMLGTVIGGADLILRDCVMRDNHAEAPGVAAGGGLRLVLAEQATVELLRCEFSGNRASGSSALGGGLAIEIIKGSVSSARLLIHGNEAVGSSQAQGGGAHLHLGASDNGFELARAQFTANRVSAPTSSLGAGLYVANDGPSSQFQLQGVTLADNLDDGEQSSDGQMQVTTGGGTFILRSLAVVDAVGTGGIVAATTNGAQLQATNLTVAGNDGVGFRHSSSSSQTHTLHNSLLFGNAGVNFSGGGNYFDGFNTIDADPGVVDAGQGNYRLAAGSSAIDAGFNGAVGGIGNIDADGNARVAGSFVDRGAYEYVSSEIFAHGFED